MESPRRQIRTTPRAAKYVVEETRVTRRLTFVEGPPACCVVDGEYVDCGAHDESEDMDALAAYQHAHRGGW